MGSKKYLTLFVAASALLLASCKSPDTVPTAAPADGNTPTSVPVLASNTPLPPAPQNNNPSTNNASPASTRIPSVDPSMAKPANIIVDGLPEDWVGSALLLEDTYDDIPSPSVMNITQLALVNIERSLYIRVEVAHTDTIFSGLELHLNDLRSVATGKHYMFFWRPGTTFFEMYDVTDQARRIYLGNTRYSEIVFDKVLEMRIDNRDMEHPENLVVTSLRFKLGNICKPTQEDYGDDVRISDVFEVPIGEIFTGEPEPETVGFTEEPIQTDIIIDGQGEDWAGRELLFRCPAGDVESGYLDLTDGYAIVNQDAVYFMIESPDPTAQADAFFIGLSAGDVNTGVIWKPDDPTSLPQNSSMAWGDVLEGRIDLGDVELPGGDIQLTIYAYYFKGEERVLIDVWMGGLIPLVNEVDP